MPQCPKFCMVSDGRLTNVLLFFNRPIELIMRLTGGGFTLSNINIHCVFECVYRRNKTQLPETNETYPIATLPDGHWTKPYYDCGGGNIWMVTYSSPIFKVTNGTATFK